MGKGKSRAHVFEKYQEEIVMFTPQYISVLLNEHMNNKKKQITQPAPIVYMLNNVMPVCGYITMAFATVSLILEVESSEMKEWLTNLDLFTYNEFYLLKERSVNPRNKRIDLNQKHLGIWYAVLYFPPMRNTTY